MKKIFLNLQNLEGKPFKTRWNTLLEIEGLLESDNSSKVADIVNAHSTTLLRVISQPAFSFHPSLNVITSKLTANQQIDTPEDTPALSKHVHSEAELNLMGDAAEYLLEKNPLIDDLDNSRNRFLQKIETLKKSDLKCIENLKCTEDGTPKTTLLTSLEHIITNSKIIKQHIFTSLYTNKAYNGRRLDGLSAFILIDLLESDTLHSDAISGVKLNTNLQAYNTLDANICEIQQIVFNHICIKLKEIIVSSQEINDETKRHRTSSIDKYQKYTTSICHSRINKVLPWVASIYYVATHGDNNTVNNNFLEFLANAIISSATDGQLPGTTISCEEGAAERMLNAVNAYNCTSEDNIYHDYLNTIRTTIYDKATHRIEYKTHYSFTRGLSKCLNSDDVEVKDDQYFIPKSKYESVATRLVDHLNKEYEHVSQSVFFTQDFKHKDNPLKQAAIEWLSGPNRLDDILEITLLDEATSRVKNYTNEDDFNKIVLEHYNEVVSEYDQPYKNIYLGAYYSSKEEQDYFCSQAKLTLENESSVIEKAYKALPDLSDTMRLFVKSLKLLPNNEPLSSYVTNMAEYRIAQELRPDEHIQNPYDTRLGIPQNWVTSDNDLAIAEFPLYNVEDLQTFSLKKLLDHIAIQSYWGNTERCIQLLSQDKLLPSMFDENNQDELISYLIDNLETTAYSVLCILIQQEQMSTMLEKFAPEAVTSLLSTGNIKLLSQYYLLLRDYFKPEVIEENLSKYLIDEINQNRHPPINSPAVLAVLKDCLTAKSYLSIFALSINKYNYLSLLLVDIKPLNTEDYTILVNNMLKRPLNEFQNCNSNDIKTLINLIANIRCLTTLDDTCYKEIVEIIQYILDNNPTLHLETQTMICDKITTLKGWQSTDSDAYSQKAVDALSTIEEYLENANIGKKTHNAPGKNLYSMAVKVTGYIIAGLVLVVLAAALLFAGYAIVLSISILASTICLYMARSASFIGKSLSTQTIKPMASNILPHQPASPAMPSRHAVHLLESMPVQRL
ncbi:hypothetical protein OAT84_01940 [Gammaproteobacteria bacterium]|nr:hypothetical protein [Gammaproteobacteria bacterium]